MITSYRRKRDIFSTLRDLHSLAGIEDPTEHPGVFFMELLKTIAKPVYHWVIETDNDKVMEKFTKRMLPETQFQGHNEEYKIKSLAEDGDGAFVWTTYSQNSLKWNPEQNF